MACNQSFEQQSEIKNSREKKVECEGNNATTEPSPQTLPAENLLCLNVL